MVIVNNKLGTPKYKQIIASIEMAIKEGTLQKGDQIPSINKIRDDNKVSRDTVLMAFNELKNRGIIKSVVGKGYYVSSENVDIALKIFLLFDELNAFKEDLYSAFLSHLGPNVQVDIFFHHFNKNSFKKLISENTGDYNFYVIMPANFNDTAPLLESLPRDKVYILDQSHSDITGYSSVYQNFEKAIHNCLIKVLDRIKNYKKLNLVILDNKQPISMKQGFQDFCDKHTIPFKIISELSTRPLVKNELYITPDDKGLLRVIKKMKNQELVIGKDIGVISYNDTLLKEIVEGGITTISTDFHHMGRTLAQMILNKEQKQIENPNHIIIRNSL